MYKKILTIAFFISISGCEFIKKIITRKEKTQIKLIARVHDKYLYLEDIKDLVPKRGSSIDSSFIVGTYVDDWIKKQLMLNTAKHELEIDQADMERRLQNYKYQLIIYEYAKKFIKLNLDTVISESEIQNYYQEHLKDFELKQNIIKSIFLKIPHEVPVISKIKSLLLSEKEGSIELLKSYAFSYASMFSFEDSTWVDFDNLILNTPFYDEIPNQVQTLKRRKFIETSDSTSVYYIKIKDYKIEDQISPLAFVRNQIINTIINKRKIELQVKHEDDIYQNAKKNKEYEVY